MVYMKVPPSKLQLTTTSTPCLAKYYWISKIISHASRYLLRKAGWFSYCTFTMTKVSFPSEITTIRTSQDRQYEHLTTVAVFLSSATVSTLQITADEAGSPLISAINTLWFISVVFSTASAVYCLLVIIWRQSSVLVILFMDRAIAYSFTRYRADSVFPHLFSAWFLNGPLYTLTGALIAFTIGLCLLAFHIADKQVSFIIKSLRVQMFIHFPIRVCLNSLPSQRPLQGFMRMPSFSFWSGSPLSSGR